MAGSPSNRPIKDGQATYEIDYTLAGPDQYQIMLEQQTPFGCQTMWLSRNSAVSVAERLLDVISSTDRLVASQPQPFQQKTYTLEEKRVKHGNAYARWTEAEEMQLAEGFQAGRTITELANVHGRVRGAIISRLQKLGLMQPKPGADGDA